MAEKILGIHDFSWQFVGYSLTPVMLVAIGSGAIYSYTLTMPLTRSLTGSWAQYLILDSVKPPLLCCRMDALALHSFSGFF